MGSSIELTNAERQDITDAFKDFLEIVGRPAKLIYPARMIACNNCLPDTIGKKSSNRWRTGGPMPFPLGSICSMCNGEGKRADEQSEEIKLISNWNAAQFILYKGDIAVPYSVVEIQGYIHDLPKIRKAEIIVLNTPLGAYLNYKFKKAGEPTDIYGIIPNEFFIGVLERAG